MRIIAVDDERPALWMLGQAIKEASGEDAALFETASTAIEYAKDCPVDVAFLDVEMDEMSGLFLARHLKDINPDTNIIFVTGHSHYVLYAFEMHVSGYVMKPIGPARVAEELANLRRPIKRKDVGVWVQCFGNFEVFVDLKPVMFGRPKAKEALAYLIDRRGADVSKKELAAVLWEDKPYSHSLQSHLYILMSELNKTLKEAGACNFIFKKRGHYAVDVQKIDCDYYRYELGDPAAVNSYRGEYMANYSWAEFTAGMLSGRQ